MVDPGDLSVWKREYHEHSPDTARRETQDQKDEYPAEQKSPLKMENVPYSARIGGSVFPMFGTLALRTSIGDPSFSGRKNHRAH